MGKIIAVVLMVALILYVAYRVGRWVGGEIVGRSAVGFLVLLILIYVLFV